MENMRELRNYVVPEIIYGVETHGLAGQYAGRLGIGTVLVVSDPGVDSAGWMGKVMDSLAAAGIVAVPFLAVTSNPKDHEIMAGVEAYRRAGCDGIIAVGGGSPIDCAKGIGIVCSNGGHILDYEGVDKVPRPIPPLVCIPSTAGSAADVSRFAIITDTDGLRKVAIVSTSVVADLALIDPTLTTTMDPNLTACTGMDTLTHAIEAYVSSSGSPFTDLHALQAARSVAFHLLAAIDDPSSVTARNGMMFASTQAGLAFSNAGLGAVHAMAHSLGGLLDSPHGDCNAYLLQHVVAYNYVSSPVRYREIGQALGFDLHGCTDEVVCEALVEGIGRFRSAVGIKGSLASQGVRPEQLTILAQKALLDACMATNPRRPTVGEIEAIYTAAL